MRAHVPPDESLGNLRSRRDLFLPWLILSTDSRGGHARTIEHFSVCSRYASGYQCAVFLGPGTRRCLGPCREASVISHTFHDGDNIRGIVSFGRGRERRGLRLVGRC